MSWGQSRSRSLFLWASLGSGLNLRGGCRGSAWGRPLGKRALSHLEGLEREEKEGKQADPARTHLAPAYGRRTSRDQLWPQSHREAGGGLSRCLGQSGGPCTCQGSGPGVRRGSMPGKVLNELPAYLHVLINHKMSPRGRIKLSVSLCFHYLPLIPLLPTPTLSCIT